MASPGAAPLRRSREPSLEPSRNLKLDSADRHAVEARCARLPSYLARATALLAAAALLLCARMLLGTAWARRSGQFILRRGGPQNWRAKAASNKDICAWPESQAAQKIAALSMETRLGIPGVLSRIPVHDVPRRAVDGTVLLWWESDIDETQLLQRLASDSAEGVGHDPKHHLGLVPQKCEADLGLERPCYWTRNTAYRNSTDIFLIRSDRYHKVPSLPVRKPGDVWCDINTEESVTYPFIRDAAYRKHFDVFVGLLRDLSDIWTMYGLDQLAGKVPDDYRGVWAPFEEKARKPSPTVALVSNCRANSFRLEYMRELMKFTKITSIGDCLRNTEMPEFLKMWRFAKLGKENKKRYISKFMFTITFHNSYAYDYVDEKLWQPLYVGSVPIVLGPPNIEDFAPGDRAYISVHDFDSPKHLGEFINRVSRNQSEYEKFLEWKKKPLRASFRKLFGYNTPYCTLCKYHEERQKGRGKQFLDHERRLAAAIGNYTGGRVVDGWEKDYVRDHTSCILQGA